MTITRWDYSKSLSNYHFDSTINEDHQPHYKVIGRIEGDLAGLYEQQLKLHTPQANSFLSRFKVQSDRDDLPFTADYDRAELEYLNLPPDHTFFYNLRCGENETIQRIYDSFRFERRGGSFHIQRPGGMFPYHIDEIPYIKGNDPNSILDREPHRAARFEIQVFDWQPGHVWAVGNTYWKQWRAGDILWHNWRDTPHGTCNFGRSDRVTLQITGICSDETLEIIKNGNHVFEI
jgi:hypothetical protein